MKHVIRTLLGIGLLAVATLAPAQAASAEVAWPTRPIRLIVPTSPGHAADIMARLLADGVSRKLERPVFVENVPGASGIVGAQAAARAEPDGYTFLFAPASLLTSNMFLFKTLPYNPTRDFTPVAMVCDRGPMVVSVNPSLPVKTIPELIAYGGANPGKLSYGVDATGGFGMAVARLLNKRGKVGMVEIPYRSTSQMLQDTLAGTTQLMISAVAPAAASAADGRLRWIGISSDQRFPGMNDLPAIAETLPGFRIDGWFAVVGPAGTPPAIAQRLNREIDAFFKSPDVRQRILAFGLAVSDAGTPESTGEFIHAEQERWRALVQEVGMEPQ